MTAAFGTMAADEEQDRGLVGESLQVRNAANDHHGFCQRRTLVPIFKQEAEFFLKDFCRPALGESINPERSSVMADSSAAVLDGGTFITGKGGDNREIKSFFLFFQTHFPLLAC